MTSPMTAYAMLCWAFCPDGAVQVEEGQLKGIDLAHCKGCGICAQECPRKAIEMVEEALIEKKG